MRKVSFSVKTSEGNVNKISCDPFQLKKEILKFQQNTPIESIMLFDEERTRIVTQQDLLMATRSSTSQHYTIYDSRKILEELIADKRQKQILDQNLQTSKKENNELKQQIEKLNNKIQSLAQEYQQTMNEKGQENSQVITNLNQKMLNQKQEYDKKLEQLNKQMYDRETELISEINGLRIQIQNKISTIDELGQAINTMTTQKTDLEHYNSQLKQSIEQQTLQQAQLQHSAAQQMEQLNQFYQQREQSIQQYMMDQQQQAAQSLAALTQEKDTLIQKLKKEIEDHHRKFKQLKKDKDEQEEDFTKIQGELKQAKTQQQETLRKLNQATQAIKSLEDEKEELSKGKSTESQASQNKERDIKKLKVEITSLNKAIEDLQSVNDTQRDQYSALLNQKEKDTRQFNEEKNELNEQITEQTATIGNLKVSIETLQKQVFLLTSQYKTSQDEQKNLLKEIANYKQQIQEVSTQGDGTNKNLKDVQQQLKTKTQELEQMTIMQDEAVKKQHALSLQVNNLEGQIRQLNLQNDNLQRNLNGVKQSETELIETNKRMIEDFTKTKEEDNQRFRAEIEFKDIIIKKVCINQQDKYIDKIIGPMEKIMNSEFKINRYQEDPNSQRDNTEYIVYEISFDKIKALNLMKEQKWICFDECLKYETLGSVKTNRSIQPNADVTLLKGYIIQIEEAENAGLKDKKLLRKEYKSQATPMLSTKEEAGKLSLNNLLCKVLLEKFNQLYGSPKIQGKQIQIQRQFVLQVKGKEEYCYCENIVEEQPFEKINGGAFQVKDSELHQYLNAFSLFTYHIMNRQLIITNLQVVGQYLHDMIVSTQYKIFTPIDQGSSEIAQTTGILEKAPQAALSKFWNEKIEQQLKQGWK